MEKSEEKKKEGSAFQTRHLSNMVSTRKRILRHEMQQEHFELKYLRNEVDLENPYLENSNGFNPPLIVGLSKSRLRSHSPYESGSEPRNPVLRSRSSNQQMNINN